jgi:hypothetical protein
MRRALLLTFACLTAAAPTLTMGASAQTQQTRETLYSLPRTVSCLDKARAQVRVIQPRDKDLRALRDLAQRTSRQAVVHRELAAFAVVGSVANAELLVELLRPTTAPYRIVRAANAVIMYRPTSMRAFRLVRSCLRP